VGGVPSMLCGRSHAGPCLAGARIIPKKWGQVKPGIAGGGCERLSSVARGKDRAGHFEGFGEATTHRRQGESRHILFGSDGQAGRLTREFGATIEAKARFFKELSGETQILGAVNAPEPEFLFIALEKIQALLEFFHCAVKRAGQKIDTERPCMTRVV